MRVQPAPGVNVRDPVSLRNIPPEGKEVPESTFWLRRLRCGDVVLCAPSVVPVSPMSDSLPDSSENL